MNDTSAARNANRTYVLQHRSVDGWGREWREYLHCVNDMPFGRWFEPFEMTGHLRRARHFLREDAALDYLRNSVPGAYTDHFSVVHVPIGLYPFDAENVYPFNID
jgi:hypothetical protein